MQNPDPAAKTIRFGAYELDLRSGELHKHGVKIKLRDKSFEVLTLLLERPGEVVRREELRARLWPADVFVDFDNNLNTAVTRLREALGDSADKPRFIETLPRRGYRFIAHVSQPARDADRASARKARLAVLPFENLSGDPAQEYFSDGMTEEMITQLAALAPERLGVIARTSAMHYKGARKDIAGIGCELDLDYAVEGSVRRAGDRVRISAQLIQVRDQTHLWAKSYDSELRNILQLQGEVAEAIVRQIDVTVSPAGQRSLRRARPVDPEAHDAYIRGLFEYNKFNPSGLDQAVEHFGLAIEKDPQYALAHAKLAIARAFIGFWGYGPPSETFPKAEAAAGRALALDDTISDAHIALGIVHWFYHWKLEACQREFERAVDLSPNDPTAHWALAMFLGSMKEDHRKAVAGVSLAQELDPLSMSIRSTAGWVFYWSRQFDRAIAHCRKTLEMDENSVQAYLVLGLAALAIGSLNEAVAALEESAARFGDLFSLGDLGLAYGLAGEREKACAVIRQLEETARSQQVPSIFLAYAHSGLEDKDQALDYLEKAYAEHYAPILWLRVSPQYDALRGDPRYERLLHRLDLPPPAC
ncbi:MAG: winged helix-turn-helix domain-containing protein [Bryobacteraceae bacterium]|jgi:TolB-like protein/Tfp pilus assembly protein PilF